MTSTSAQGRPSPALAALFAGLLLAAPGVAAGPTPKPWVRKIELEGRAPALRQETSSAPDRPEDLAGAPRRPRSDRSRAGRGRVQQGRAARSQSHGRARRAGREGGDRGGARRRRDAALPPRVARGRSRRHSHYKPSLSTRGKILYFRLDARLFRFNRKQLDNGLQEGAAAPFRGSRVEVRGVPGRRGVRGGTALAQAVVLKLELGPREKLKGNGKSTPARDAGGEASWKGRNVPLSEGVVARLSRGSPPRG